MTEGRSWKWRLQVGVWVIVALLVLSTPAWGPRALSHLSFFRMQKVEVRGIRFLSEAELLQRLGVDTTWSIWTDVDALADSVAKHPQVKSAKASRRLPGTLVLYVEEKLPIAMVPHAEGLKVVDERGEQIPVDPSRSDVDVPIVHGADTTIVRLLAELREESPSLFARISEARRTNKQELRIDLLSYPVLANADVTVGRLADILRVERDLAIRGVKVAEIDLRFHGQVIARLQ